MANERKTHFPELQTQFLCCVPIKKIQWKDELKDLSWDKQKRLLDETVNFPALEKYPLDINYIVRFLRFAIDALENQNLEIHDDFYTTLCTFQSKTNDCTEYSYKHYRIPANTSNGFETVLLKENRNKISQGTTGLNVWESALAISEWAIQNKGLFENKQILELGAGTGLSSLIIGKCCSPNSIHITDGNDKVIENLLENVCNNFKKTANERCYQHGETVIDVMKLDWSETSKEIIEQNFKNTDIIIAADIIYDNSLFDSLLTTLRMLFDYCDNCEKFMLVNALRNPETEQEFLRKLGEFGLQYQEEPTINPRLLYWEPNEFSPIKLYSIINIKHITK